MVLDCDGRVADALVREPAPPPARSAVRCCTPTPWCWPWTPPAPEKVDADFAEFDRFLRWMEQYRGLATDVGGLPVFLVLTKCDLLARPGQTAADWLEQIEERKRNIGGRFQAFLADRRPPAFGRIHLHLWATAVLRPPLAGGAAQPTDPYGVAELFRQSFGHAATFRRRREHSNHRLAQMTIAVVGGFLGLLAVTGSLIVADALRRPPSRIGNPRRNPPLRRAEDAGRAAARRARRDRLRPYLEQWQAIRSDPDFAALPQDMRTYVEERRSELETYIPWLEAWRKRRHRARRWPKRSCTRSRRGWTAPWPPPRPDWDDTDAGRLRRQLSAEDEALLGAIAALRTWYQHAYAEGDALWTFAGHDAGGPDWNGSAGDAERQLDPAHQPPYADAAAVPNVDPPLTYAAVRSSGRWRRPGRSGRRCEVGCGGCSTWGRRWA